MKLLALLGIAWSIFVGLIFLNDQSYRHRLETMRQSEQLQRDSKAVELLIGARNWPVPLKESRQWKELESQFNADILPSSRTTASLSSPGKAQVRGDRLSISINIEETLSSGGPMEQQPTTNNGAKPAAVVISRAVSPLSTRSTNIAIGSIYLLGLAILVLLKRLGDRQVREHSVALAQWAESVENHATDSPLQLPRILSEDENASYLNIVAERANAVNADLYSTKHRTELVLDNLQDGVLAVNEHSQILLLAGAIDQHLQLSGDNYLYRLLLEVVRVPQVTDLIAHVLETGSPSEGVFDIATSSKSLRLIARPIRMDGQRVGAILISRDETLVKRVEAVRKDFIANASHELKTPLAAIRAYAETLQMGALEDPPAAERFVDGIVTQADQIDGLIQGMLQLSRIESGSGIQIEQFDACTAIQPCIAAALAMASSKGVDFNYSAPEEPLKIRSDINGFQTIASNLISNAVRYTPAGGSVQASLSRDDQQCTLVVEDTGIGIRKEDLERIFERFYRAEKDRSSETGGTGLGLSIVKHLTNGLGGSVDAWSEPGKGSRFAVSLPLATLTR